MIWLKMRNPDPPPGVGAHVDHEALMTSLANAEQAGAETPVTTFLRGAAPKMEVDDWGDPLPLPPEDQDYLDRIFAILAAPQERGRALLTTGALAPDEVEALQTVYPPVWHDLVAQAYREMIETPRPFAGWVTDVLAVLFGMEADVVFTDGPPKEPPQPQKDEQTLTAGVDGAGTQADRRDTAVRQAKAK